MKRKNGHMARGSSEWGGQETSVQQIGTALKEEVGLADESRVLIMMRHVRTQRTSRPCLSVYVRHMCVSSCCLVSLLVLGLCGCGAWCYLYHTHSQRHTHASPPQGLLTFLLFCVCACICHTHPDICIHHTQGTQRHIYCHSDTRRGDGSWRPLRIARGTSFFLWFTNHSHLLSIITTHTHAHTHTGNQAAARAASSHVVGAL